MRIEAALIAPAAYAPASAGADGGFAELLGGWPKAASGPLLAAGLDGAIGGAGRGAEDQDAGLAAQAFAFGAFGLFGPGAALGETAHERLGLAGPALDEAEWPSVPGASLEEARLAGVAVEGADGVGAAAVGVAGSGPAAGTTPDLHVAQTANAMPPATRTSMAAADEAEPVKGSAPAEVRRPANGRSTPVSLLVAEEGGRLTLVAQALLGAGGTERARTRLAEAAAGLGVSLDEIVINGDAGGTPAARGARHGHRAG